MALTPEEVRHVAMLARIALTDEEVAALAPQLAQILAWAETVGEVAAADVAPTSHPYPLRNVFRDDDAPAEPLGAATVLSGAPDAEAGRFAVPPILSVQQ